MPWLLLGVAIASGAAGGARAELPSVAWLRLSAGHHAPDDARGLVFFLGIGAEPGAAAIGTAHLFSAATLAEAERVEFLLAGSQRAVASSSRFLAPPGRPFDLPDATLRDDFMIYALERAPKGIRILEAAQPPTPSVGARVRILGPPALGGGEQDAVYGEVARVSTTRIDVDLEARQDLSGWGGAPILLAHSGRVVGVLEAHVPHGPTARVLAAPLAGVVEALEKPLAAGAGRPFAAYARDAHAMSRAAPAREDPEPASPPAGRGALLTERRDEASRVFLSIDFPADGAVVTDTICGVFVSGRAHALSGAMHRFDVVMVIDTSRSTLEPAGADINGNGTVGRSHRGRIASIFGSGGSDRGDSILAAEVAAARQVLRGLDPRSTRVALVTFAGDADGDARSSSASRAALTREPLTRKYAQIEQVLDQVLRTKPDGNTHMAAGVDQATIELLGLRGASSHADARAEKIVFFFTDGQPTLPYGPEMEADNVRAVLRAADRARRGGIRIHSFAIGPEALEGPIATVEMATRTDGYFTPVRHPGDLLNLVEEVSFAKLEAVQLTSDTMSAPAQPFRISADGAWAGLVPMRPGENHIRVRARSADGAEAEKQLAVTLVPEAPAPPIPAPFIVQRNRLLEDCLRESKQQRRRAEQDHAESVRRELKIEIERERAHARARATEQRKQLELEVDDAATGAED